MLHVTSAFRQSLGRYDSHKIILPSNKICSYVVHVVYGLASSAITGRYMHNSSVRRPKEVSDIRAGNSVLSLMAEFSFCQKALIKLCENFIQA